MNANNVVVIISNNIDTVEFIRSKLVLLRDLDRIEHANTIDAVDCLKDNLPNSILLHCEADDKKRFKLLEEIKNEPALKNIPIILLEEKCTDDFLFDMFDKGISDILKLPIKEHELLFRIMWSIQRNEMQTSIDIKNKFLSNLGIIELDTGFYKSKYCEEFLENEVDYTIKNKNHASIMLVSVQTEKKEEIKKFSKILKKSVRLNDSVGISDVGKYYIFLPKTKLNGAYALFERIKANSDVDYKSSATVVEVYNRPFNKLKDLLQETLERAKKDENSLLVVSDIAQVSEDVKVFKSQNIKVIDDDAIKTALNSALKAAIKEPVLETDKKPVRKNVKTQEEKESAEADKRNSIVFKQVYQKKCELVIEPVFEKFKEKFEDKEHYTFIEYKTDFKKSFFKVIKGANELMITINYNGYSKIKVDLTHIFNTRIKENKSLEIDLVDFNREKLTNLFKNFPEMIKAC